MLEAILLAVLLPIMNRAAGSDIYNLLLNRNLGRAIYYISILLFLTIILVTHDLMQSAIIASGFLLWRIPAWSRWYDLGNKPDGYHRPNGYTKFEDILHKLAFKNDYLAFLYRNFIFIMPLMFYDIRFIFLPFLIVFSYHIAWLLDEIQPIPKAEYFAGFAWAIVIISVIS